MPPEQNADQKHLLRTGQASPRGTFIPIPGLNRNKCSPQNNALPFQIAGVLCFIAADVVLEAAQKPRFLRRLSARGAPSSSAQTRSQVWFATSTSQASAYVSNCLRESLAHWIRSSCSPWPHRASSSLRRCS